MMDAIAMIRQRRTGLTHSEADLRQWIADCTEGKIPDYQMAAWLMAGVFQPLDAASTAILTSAMVDSGRVVDWPAGIAPVLVDKHSTGGVGDKISLVLAPLVAAVSHGHVAVPMMAGRGLGHTGGTIDKLESIPGFRANLTIEELKSKVLEVGCAITATGPELCPADKKLYALRDVTSTVSCVPYQVSSILCKKIAEAPSALVLDVKYGKGAFQDNLGGAVELATSLVEVAEANGLATTALLTKMDHPIGTSVGNWLEVEECLAVMRGDFENRFDLIELIVAQAVEMLKRSGCYNNTDDNSLALKCLEALRNGSAMAKFEQMVEAQGGDRSCLSAKPRARHQLEILAMAPGFLANVDALEAGLVAVDLGAGRKVAEDEVDAEAGIWLHVKVGDRVKRGQPVATLYTNQSVSVLEAAATRLAEAITYSEAPVATTPNVTHKVTKERGLEPVALLPALEQVK